MNAGLTRRGLRDRDFLSTREGFLFCVVGPYHPTDRVISYVKYLPDPKGKWRRGKDGFRRVLSTYTIPSLLETFSVLEKEYPQYLFFSPVYKITMTAVPKSNIVTHFKPEMRLAGLLKQSPLDSLQQKVLRLVSSLSEASGVREDCFGVTGSILLDIHSLSFSDMDIIVYGFKNSHLVKGAFESRLVESLGFRCLRGERLRKWYATKTENHPLSLLDARLIFRRKWNTGTFEDTLFSVHPVRLETELTEKYGDKTYHPSGLVTLRAIVSDSRDSIFLPAVYRVEEVEVVGGEEVDVEEVVSYEGLYDSLAEKGEAIEARGKLEHVVDRRTGEEYDRVLVGSPEGMGREYIKPLQAQS